jgi:hypothetical protein
MLRKAAVRYYRVPGLADIDGLASRIREQVDAGLIRDTARRMLTSRMFWCAEEPVEQTSELRRDAMLKCRQPARPNVA